MIKLTVQSVAHLDPVVIQIRAYGTSSTTIVLSTVVAQRPVTRAATAPGG
jgi:hypothetical protein